MGHRSKLVSNEILILVIGIKSVFFYQDSGCFIIKLQYIHEHKIDIKVLDRCTASKFSINKYIMKHKFKNNFSEF